MAKKEYKLNPKQTLFCHKYIEHRFNGTRAYMDAYGASARVAGINAVKLLGNTIIKSYINKEIRKILDDTTELEKQIIDEYKKIAFSDIKNYIDPDTGEYLIEEDTDTAALESIQIEESSLGENRSSTKKRFKMYDKLKALDSLAKLHIGLTEKHRLVDEDGNDRDLNVTIEVIKEKE